MPESTKKTWPELTKRGWMDAAGRWWILGLAMALAIFVRLRLLAVPLERDEGDHAYSAQLMLQGIPPWKLSYNMKLPGADAMYAVALACFGQSAAAIHLGLLLANVAATILVALLGKRLWGSVGGAVSGAFYAILSLNPAVLPIAAHATHFVVLAALAGLLILRRAAERSAALPVFAAGLAFGIAVLMKQPGAVFALFGFLYLAWRARLRAAKDREIGKLLLVYGAGVAIPFGLLCLSLWLAGVFPRFWFWTVTLAGAFSSLRPLSSDLWSLKVVFRDIVTQTWPFWLWAALGLVLSLVNRVTRPAGLYVAALLVTSFAATSAGGLFTSHYFVLLLPAVSLAAGGASAVPQRFRRRTASVAFVCALSYFVAAQWSFLFQLTPNQVSRSEYGLNPFPEAVEVARYIASHTQADARVAVLGSESEIYFYSRRRSATGFLFAYSLTEPSRFAESLQGEMIGEIEGARPEYAVLVRVLASWFYLTKADPYRPVFFWMKTFLERDYDLAGIVDINNTRTVYQWDRAAQDYTPTSESLILVYRRKSISEKTALR